VTVARPDPPHPPNRGAHGLAWWLSGGDTCRRLRRLERDGFAAPSLDRVLCGEIVPAPEVAAAIAKATKGEVRPEHWDERAGGGWFDRPDYGPS
jgi:hypothetical protein